MFNRIVRSSKVQAAFGSFLAAVLFAAGGGQLNEDVAAKIVDACLTYVVPALLIAIGIEDGAKKIADSKKAPTPPEDTP